MNKIQDKYFQLFIVVKTIFDKKEEIIKNQDAKFNLLSNCLGSKIFLIDDAITIADFELYNVMKWHDELDYQLIS